MGTISTKPGPALIMGRMEPGTLLLAGQAHDYREVGHAEGESMEANYSTIDYCPRCGTIVKHSPISASEVEVLRAYASGGTTKTIAYDRCVSIKTIESQRQSLLRKSKQKTIPQAVAWAIQIGLIQIHEPIIIDPN